MKNSIFFVIIFIILKSNLITLAKTNIESNISDGIHAILIKCPKDSANETCEPHLIISIHMNPSVDLNKLEASWILDEVYDPTKRTISKIISPYLIVVGRGEPVVMYPLQYEESIKHEEFRKEQPTKNDNPKGPPSSQSAQPRPSINMKEREKVKGYPTQKIDGPRPLINMKVGEDEPPSKDDAKDDQDSPSVNPNEPNPSVTMKDNEDGKVVLDSPSDQNNEPSINIREREDEKPTSSKQGVVSSKTNDEQATGDLAKDVQDSLSLRADDPNSLKNMKDREDEQPIEDDVKDSQGSLSSNTNESYPSINARESEDDGVQGSPSGLNESCVSNDPRGPINIKDQKGVEKVQSSPSDATQDASFSISTENQGRGDGSPYAKRNDVHIKKYEQRKQDDVKNLQDPPSRNESEINDASRTKRNQGVVYTSKQTIGFNIAFVQKTPSKSTNVNHHEPMFNQNDISNLGLIEVTDPSLRKDRIESPKALQKVDNKIQNNKNQDERKNKLKFYQYYDQELDRNDQNNLIKKDREAPVPNTDTWDIRLLDEPKQDTYQEGKKEITT
ncbi:uncharacterized protein LOC110190990 isoform X2 [Drosophila serrata]|uniref:uncharacterized protein LOC110190990 isoform X2 n=1 Tax=Drosophila serrata TaxID=7274 RepID=UPI000A1D2F05|nr:uncharacterized protein LOC110190990 isoform X2 [Drosophila serrata]